MVDMNSIAVNGNIVTLTVRWEEPFINFDPILSYTISCFGSTGCPTPFTTSDNVTRNHVFQNLISNINYTFEVVARNSLGTGNPGVVIITAPSGKVHVYNCILSSSKISTAQKWQH